MPATLSRRDLFGRFLKPLREAQSREAEPAATEDCASYSRATPAAGASPRVAIIQGRFCIALTSFCSVCVERCPVPGAMRLERGVPFVSPECCTGCGVCQEVCPAPRNAVLLMPSKKNLNLHEH